MEGHFASLRLIERSFEDLMVRCGQANGPKTQQDKPELPSERRACRMHHRLAACASLFSGVAACHLDTCWARRLLDLFNELRRLVEIAPGQAKTLTPILAAVRFRCGSPSETLSPDTCFFERVRLVHEHLTSAIILIRAVPKLALAPATPQFGWT